MNMNRIEGAASEFAGLTRVEFGQLGGRLRRSLPLAMLTAAMSLVAPAARGELVAVTKAFSPSAIAVGTTSTLTITIRNQKAKADDIVFTDSYPANLRNAATPAVSSDCGGTVAAVAGGSSLSLTGGKLAGNNTCTISVQVTSAVAGSYVNSTGLVTSPDSASVGPASATLTVTASAAAPGSFNAFESATAAGATTGVIRTRVAGTPFSLDVVALSGGAQASSFGQAVRVELLGNVAPGTSLDGSNCPTSATLLQTVAPAPVLAGGRATVGFAAVSNSWRDVRVRISYPASSPSVVSCSTDNFAIRPASFDDVTASDADSATAGTARVLANTGESGGNVHKAGRPFSLTATARNAAGAVTANYAGSPLASLTACVLPASGCSPGVLATGAWAAASGTVTTSQASYSEVGAFTMKLADADFAAVDAADGSTATERTIESAAVSVGRFVPDHFELAAASTPVFKTFNDIACPARSFTYVGQPFGYLTLPQATIAAKNAAGATTLNYAGTLWKLEPAGTVQSYTPVTGNLDIGLLGVPTVTASGGGVGALIANAADELAFVRTTPVAPFVADISLSMSIQDIAENAVTGNGVIDTAAPALFPGIAFDSGNEIRFGQLVLSNAHGPELLGLPVPIEARYWNGSGFARNAADSCTQLSATQVPLSAWRRDLNACETSVTLSGRFSGGRGNLRLSAPGAGNTGSVDLAVQLGATAAGSSCVGGAAVLAGAAAQSWLQGRGSGGTYDQNPAARASFGLHRGSRPLIYQREMY